MFKYIVNRRGFLFLLVVIIVLAGGSYAHYLSKKIAAVEKKKVELWVEAQKNILYAQSNDNIDLAVKISTENVDIPIIETDENDRITPNYKNIDSVKIAHDKNYLRRQLEAFKKENPPIVLVLSEQPYRANYYYYGNSNLYKKLFYFPLMHVLLVALLLLLIFISEKLAIRGKQNSLWVGMAKETAHQLGTPISSLEGWLAIIKDIEGNAFYAEEIKKDVDRLKLISERFSKIGSKPSLQPTNIVLAIEQMVDYIKRRAGEQVLFLIHKNSVVEAVPLSPALFDWVIENILKNALDAMDKKGTIEICIDQKNNKVLIDITDTGKGIASKYISTIFNPGFSTKKRGWGLGLTLVKRVVEDYHNGRIFVKKTALGKGTTFRIELPLL